MAKCLMLDVDGVLIDGRPQDGKRWDTALHDDLGIDPDLLGKQFFARDWAEIVIGKKALRPALAACLQRLPTTVDADTLIAYWFKQDSRIITPVLSDCRAARDQGVAVFLATNQEHDRAAYLMEDLALKHEVDGIIYSAQAECRKPDPAFYAYAVSVTGCAPQDHILVDDTEANIAGARAAGWQAVHWDGSRALGDILKSANEHGQQN